MFKYKNKSVYICHYIAGKLRKYITNLESYLTTIYNNRKIILLFTNTEMLSQNIYASIWTILNKKRHTCERIAKLHFLIHHVYALSS